MPNIAKVDKKGVVASQQVTPMAMIQIALEQGADIDKLTKLMDLQERWEANEAKKAYVAAMSRFREDCPAIDKTRNGHNSKYSGLAETIEQIKIVLSENGLSHSWKTEQTDRETKVTCTITHISGHSETTTLSAPADTSGSKNQIQAIGSTITYLQRYTLFSILGLASKEMDTDGNQPIEYINDAQNKEINDLIAELKVDEVAFLKYLQCPSVAHIRATEYKRAINLLEKKRAK